MSGNVWEWCEDVVNSSDRRLRGGGWRYVAVGCPVAYRGGYSYQGYRDYIIGLRLARSSGN